MADSFAALQHYIHTFDWVPGVTPLSSINAPIIATIVYILGLYIVPVILKDRPAYRLSGWVAAHNLLLCVWSLIMFVAITYYIALWALRGGFFRIVCDPDELLATGPHVFWYYIFYISKYYEFLDTLLQLLRKKQPILLHTYHHIITLWLVWVCLDSKFSLQWSDIIANAFVHIPMYYYYYLSERGGTIWWKKYITRVQIVQFVLDMSVHILWFYWTKVVGYNCSGTMWVFLFGNFVIMSFLLLFIKFYVDAYKKHKKTK